MAHSRKLRTILDAADHRIDEGAGMDHEEFWRQVESANRVREENGSGKKRRTKCST
ncbi:MAG TPA: hypothetical protein VMV69_03180 [Pirellulales bacterium]|nr:hypothetical protein [Pirellulales bacterium]